jgi:hypothetical protein
MREKREKKDYRFFSEYYFDYSYLKGGRKRKAVGTPEHSPLALPQNKKLNSTKKEVHPELFIPKGFKKSFIEQYITSPLDKSHLVSIQPVHLLKSMEGRGLFAKVNIPQGTCLGIYTGEEYTKAKFNRYLMNNKEADTSYAMIIEERVVDARTKGNFTRYINYSDTQANVVFAQEKLKGKKVAKALTLRDIKKGEQLLADYNIYNEKVSKHFYFLNPSDNSLSATKLYQAHKKSYYCMEMKNVIKQFGIKIGDHIYMTAIGEAVLFNKKLDKKLLNKTEIDLPYLYADAKGISDFTAADVFTPFMAACYLGQANHVSWLIQQGTNIDQQQHLSGNCPLFLVLCGYKDFPNNRRHFINIILKLISAQANLRAHDRADRTFLHQVIHVVTSKELSLIMKAINPELLPELFTYINESGDDPFMSCLRVKLFDKAKTLLNWFPDYFTYYDERGNKQEREYNKKAFAKAIADYSSHEKEALFRVLKDERFGIKEELFMELGFYELYHADNKNVYSN